MAKKVAVINQKGGVAKSTATLNLGGCLAVRGYEVLLLDMDPQGTLTKTLCQEKRFNKDISSWLLDETSFESIVTKTKVPGMSVVPSDSGKANDSGLAKNEGLIKSSGRDKHALSIALAPVLEKNIYDVVLIDNPPSLELSTANSLWAADYALIPTFCESSAESALWATLSFLSNIKLSKRGVQKDVEVLGILANNYHSRETTVEEKHYHELKKLFPAYLMKSVIRHNVAVKQAADAALPVISFSKNSIGAQDFEAFTDEFISLCKLQKPKKEQKPQKAQRPA